MAYTLERYWIWTQDQTGFRCNVRKDGGVKKEDLHEIGSASMEYARTQKYEAFYGENGLNRGGGHDFLFFVHFCLISVYGRVLHMRQLFSEILHSFFYLLRLGLQDPCSYSRLLSAFLPSRHFRIEKRILFFI